MEFTKCQGCQLLTSLPSAARATLVHFEVVAVLAPFHIQPRFLPTSPAAASASAGGGGGVPHKCFVYGVVTDWSLLLLSMPSAASAPTLLLELPLLMLQSMESHAGVNAGDVVNDRRGDVQTSCISIYPQQQQQHQPCGHHKQQQQALTLHPDPASRVVQALQDQLQRHLGIVTPQQQQHQQQQAPWQQQQQPPCWQQQAAAAAAGAAAGNSRHQVLKTVPERMAASDSDVQDHSAAAVGAGVNGGSSTSSPWLQSVRPPAANNCNTQVQHLHTRGAATCSQTQQQQQQQQQGVHNTNTNTNSSSSYCLELMTVERHSMFWFHLHRAWVGAHMRAALAAAGAPGLSSWVPPKTCAHSLLQQQFVKSSASATARAGSKAAARQRHTVDILVLDCSEAGDAQQQPQQQPLDGGLLTQADGCSSSHEQQQQQQVWRRASISTCYEHRHMQGDSNSSNICLSSGAACGQQQASSTTNSRGSLRERPHTASAALHSRQRPVSAGAPQQQSQQQQQPHNSSSRSSSRPSTGEAKQLLLQLQQQQQQPVSGGGLFSQWPRWVRRLSLANNNRLSVSRGAVGGDAGAAFDGSVGVAGGGGDTSRGSSLSPSSSPPASRGGGGGGAPWRPVSRGQQHVLREFMQAGAEVLVQPTAAVAREVLFELADSLLRPCSLFDVGDTLAMHKGMMELASANREQAAAMQAAFFGSSQVMEFIVGRLTSWGALMGLFTRGLPPIQNPAQPGCIEAWQGRPVVWATWLVYPSRPKDLLRQLGLTAHSGICFRSALQAALSVSQHHRAATRAWNSSGSSSGGSDIRQVPLGQTYYADPLNLSPLHQMPYLFVACARRMLGDLGLSGSGSSSSLSGGGESAAMNLAGELFMAAGRRHSSSSTGATSADATNSNSDLASKGTLAEVTVVLRWERLVGRLAAAAAERKVVLLLQWLQLHLAFTEGCSSRGTWLSHKALTSCQQSGATSSGGGGVLPPTTFRAATQQLVAYLLTLHIPHVRTCLAATPPAAALSHHASTTSEGSSATSAATHSTSGGRGGGSTTQQHQRQQPQQGASLGPETIDDFLWWAEGRCSSTSSSTLMLDCCVGVLYELLGVAQQQEQLLTGTHWAAGAVVEVLREVPPSCLHPLLQAVFLRFICLMTAAAAVAEADNSSGRNSTSSRVVAPSASTAPPAAAPAVLAFRYGSVLLELLGGVLGCAGHLQEAFGVEVQHLMRVPQVEAKLAAVAQVSNSGVLGELNAELLAKVLAAVRAAEVLLGGSSSSSSCKAAPPLTQQLRPVGCVMKVQN